MRIIEAELSKYDLGKLDDMFREYQTVDYKLAEREFKIRYPYRVSDENIGGGKSAMRADAEQRILEKIEDDKQTQWLRKVKSVCEAAISQFDGELLAIYKLRYTEPIRYSWDAVGQLMEQQYNKGKPNSEKRYYPHSTIYRKRYALLKLLGKQIGWI